MDMITVTAKTYDEAVTNALIELGTTSEHLYVEVVQRETAGLFGVLGGKSCIINARIMTEEEEAQKKTGAGEKKEASENIEKKDEAGTKETKTDEVKTELSDELKEKIAKQNATIAKRRMEAESHKDEAEKNEEKGEHRPVERELKPISKEDAKKAKENAEEFIKSMLLAMNVKASLDTSFNHETNELNIILSGDDMGVLIGKRGQTLDSMQYLVSLVINKKHDGYIRVKLDTENYRERRKEKLENLAKSIARKVSKTHRAVSLEPMNPYERRIIHSVLQSDRYVITDSEGEDPYRHVIIKPKRY